MAESKIKGNGWGLIKEFTNATRTEYTVPDLSKKNEYLLQVLYGNTVLGSVTFTNVNRNNDAIVYAYSNASDHGHAIVKILSDTTLNGLVNLTGAWASSPKARLYAR